MPKRRTPPPAAAFQGIRSAPARLGAGFIRHADFRWPAERREFPFNIPAFANLRRLELHPAVTFFIGENGSGKSTLLEALAVRSGFRAEGGWKQRAVDEVTPSSGLDHCLELERYGYPGDGWFLRAESFYNIATELEEADERTLGGHSFHGFGGKALHAQSHGEAFLSLLNNRLTGDGLYFFDEPEAALSPQRQLAVLTLLHHLVREHSQLIIATHSPILLAYPHARLYEFAPEGIRETTYEETEHFQVTRNFLAQRDRMVELLLADDGAA